MYLKEIVATGFKSFADKLDIKLDDKTTCIVGPNGSGKSNVVDAVRWVLGEQSVKSLRGSDSMSDVIFSGSKSRNPLNVASVELIFDNSDHFLPVPYTEISIKRRVYRSGENEYYINGEKCRLKDVNNLLMDSGMGKESFNIISQGEVEKILSNSATDRRIIFEEAAGILKYKKRKEEALRKLDRTHSNLDRVNDIISELEIQVGPLKEQSEKAKEYLENKKGLDTYEVALLAYDIENNNQELQQAQAKKEKLDKEIVTISNETSKNDVTSLEDSTKLERLEQEKANLNRRLLQVTEEVEKINGEKNLLKERSKTTKEENELKEEIRNLLEQKSRIERDIVVLTEEISSILSTSKKEEEKDQNLLREISTLKSKKNMLNNDYSKHDQEIISISHKIASLRQEIEQGGDIPNSVRNVLKSTTLTGIHNTIGNLITTEDKYTKALNIAISANKNFIITSDEETAKKAINYLKDNHLGRATFFPLSVIKGRYVDQETLNLISSSQDFIGVLSDLISYNQKYQSIMENQFGTVLVASTMDGALRLSKIIRNKYKIITLDGDVINVGGSMTGGSTYTSKSLIMTKQELKHAEEKEKYLREELTEISKELQSVGTEISSLEEKNYEIARTKVTLKETYDSKSNEIKELRIKLENITKEWESLESISNNSISEKEQELIKLFHERREIFDFAIHDGVVNCITDGDRPQTVNALGEDIEFAVGIFTEEDVFEDQRVTAAMSAFIFDDMDTFSAAENRVIVDKLVALIRFGQSCTAGSVEVERFQTAVGTVDRQTVSFKRGGEVCGVVQQSTVFVFDISHIGIVDIDFGIEHAHIRTVVGISGGFGIKSVDVVIGNEDSGIAGRPAGFVFAIHKFFTFVAVTAVFFGRIERSIRTIVVQSTESVDFFRNSVDPPVDQIEVVTGFVDGQAAGIFPHSVPAMEIAGAVFDVDVPGQIDVGDSAEFAFEDHFAVFSAERRVTVVESANDFAFGFFLGFHHFQGVGGVGGHRFFADDFEVMFQTAEDVIDVSAVHAGHDDGIGFLFSDHFFKVGGEILRSVLGFGNQLFANFEAKRVNIQKTDQFGTMSELVHHRFDVHTDTTVGYTAHSVTFFSHFYSLKIKLFRESLLKQQLNIHRDRLSYK